MRRLILACGVALVVTTASCTRYDRGTLGPSAIDALVTFTVTPESLSANGVSTATLRIAIPPDRLGAARPTVTFSTTDGTFTIGSNTDTHQAAVILAANGEAATELRSSTTVHSVKVDASVTLNGQVVRQTRLLPFVAPSADETFVLDAASSTLQADGFSRVRVTATLKFSGGDVAQRTVTFSSEDNQLIAFGKTPGKSQSVVAAADGTALVDVQSTKNIGAFDVVATIGGVTRRVTITQVAIDPQSIIRLSAPTRAPADGASQSTIIATVAAGLPQGQRSVTFAISPAGNGSASLSQTSATADSSNRAIVSLTSGTLVGQVRITASVDGWSDFATVLMEVAPPDGLEVTVVPPIVQANNTDSVAITATLRRNTGKPSAGTTVSCVPTNGGGVVVGSIAAVTASNESGVATAKFYPGASTAPGVVTITCAVPGTGLSVATAVTVVP